MIHSRSQRFTNQHSELLQFLDKHTVLLPRRHYRLKFRMSANQHGRRFVIYTNSRTSLAPTTIPSVIPPVPGNTSIPSNSATTNGSFVLHSSRPARTYSFTHPSRPHGPVPYAEYPGGNSEIAMATGQNQNHTRHAALSRRFSKHIRWLRRLFHSRNSSLDRSIDLSTVPLPPRVSSHPPHAAARLHPYITNPISNSSPNPRASPTTSPNTSPNTNSNTNSNASLNTSPNPSSNPNPTANTSHGSRHLRRGHASLPHSIFSRARISIPTFSTTNSRARSTRQEAPPVQFNTLSMLLQTVSVSTLRRLLHEDDASIGGHVNLDADDLQHRYTGRRLDRTDIPPGEDTTFNEFLHRLDDGHLLEQEFLPQLQSGRSLSFFRAFRFARTNSSEAQPSNVPIMIVGLVSVNRVVRAGSVRVANSDSNATTPNSVNQGGETESDDVISAGSIISHTASPASSSGTPLNGDTAQMHQSVSSQPPETPAEGDSTEQSDNAASNTYRSWIIVVMAHHYEASDSVLDSMPVLIDLLTAYISSTNGIINPTDTTFFNSRSVSAGNMDEFRNSLDQLLNRHSSLSRDQLSHKPETICVFRPTTSNNATWKEKAAFLDGRNPVAYYNPGDHCPICLVEYTSGDLGRKLDCKHAFHRSCIDEWLVNDNTCPICRSKALKV